MLLKCEGLTSIGVEGGLNTVIEQPNSVNAIPAIGALLEKIRELDPLKNPNEAVVLISASLPGSGSTTIAHGVASFLRESYGEPELRLVGGNVRARLGAESDDQLMNKLSEVPDPLHFDRDFYDKLPGGKPVVIEGKLATDFGPLLLSELGESKHRPIIAIKLISHPLLSTIRVMQREGWTLPSVIANPTEIPVRAMNLSRRAKHIRQMIESITRSTPDLPQPDATIGIDTASFNQNEIIGLLSGRIDWLDRPTDWEERSLIKAICHLEEMSMTRDLLPNLKDAAHYHENIEGVRYNLTERLYRTMDARAIEEIRQNIRTMLTHAIFALLLKKMPRFVRNKWDNAILLDTLSQKWTPEYYKMMVGWPTIKLWLSGKDVLDPFAGAGTFVNVLTARGIVKHATLGDISYVGGVPLNEFEGMVYDPNLNTAMIQAVFNGLPSWYKPQCLTRLTGYVTLDARRLPFANDSFDFTTGDPPYGINLNDGGIDLLIECLPEMIRVSRNGCLLLVPVAWIENLNNFGVKQLTLDLANGKSDVPTCFVHIPK